MTDQLPSFNEPPPTPGADVAAWKFQYEEAFLGVLDYVLAVPSKVVPLADRPDWAANPNLIRLRHDGRLLIPGFQLGPNCAVITEILEINFWLTVQAAKRLIAWADFPQIARMVWWLRPHPQLHGRSPLKALDSMSPEHLRDLSIKRSP